jgi:hypothetical protein
VQCEAPSKSLTAFKVSGKFCEETGEEARQPQVRTMPQRTGAFELIYSVLTKSVYTFISDQVSKHNSK